MQQTMVRLLSRGTGLVLVLGLALSVFSVAGPAGAQTAIKLGHDQPESSPHHQAAVKFKEMVESGSGGKLTVQIFPASMLGSGTQMVEQVQAGALEAAALPTAWIAPLAPSVSVLDLPFLFPSRAVAYNVIDGPVGAEILKPLNKVNIEGVVFWESGFKQFTGDFPIRTPDDYKGHKIRTMPAPVIMEQFKAFGATPTPINFKELYSALQQKVVDGQENPIATIASMRFYEVQPHLTLSDHGFLAYVLMFNKPFLEKLTADQRKLLADAGAEARDYQRQIIQAAEATNLKIFEEAGVKVTKLSAEQRAAFANASESVHTWYANKYGSGTLDKIKQAVAAANN